MPYGSIRRVFARQLDSIPDNRVAIARLNAPGIVCLDREYKGRWSSHRLGSQVSNVTPEAIVVFRVNRHGEPDRSRSAFDSHRYIKAGEIGRIDCNCVVNAGLALWCAADICYGGERGDQEKLDGNRRGASSKVRSVSRSR